MSLSPVPGDALAHAEFLFAGETGALVELKYDDPNVPKHQRKLNLFKRFPVESLGEMVDFAMTRSREGRRVYIAPGLRFLDTPDRASTGADVDSWTSLPFDFDSLEDAERGLQIAREIGLPFHLVVRTGQLRRNGEPDLRIQCWVKLAVPCNDMPLVCSVLARGIAVLGSDTTIKDAVRVMRLAGGVSWATKDGRQDEVVRIDCRYMDLAAEPLLIEEIDAILAGGVPLPPATRRLQPLIPADLAVIEGTIWRDNPAVAEAQRELLSGVEMNPNSVLLVQKALRDGVDRPLILAGLMDLYTRAEETCGRPERLEELRYQAPALVTRLAASMGEVEAYKPPGAELELVEDVAPPDPLQKMMRDYAWCPKIGRAVRLSDGETFDKACFEAEHTLVAPVGSRGVNSSLAIFLNHTARQNIDGVDFLYGGPRYIPDPYGQGRYLNLFRGAPVLPPAPTDDDVRPFLDHMAIVIPDPFERETTLNWQTWCLQNPTLKPNWALVIGSSVQGIGKGLMLRPFICAIGRQYVASPDAGQLISSAHNEWLVGKRLLNIQEMERFEKARVTNLLKGWLACPPWTLMINPKGRKQFDIRNQVIVIIETNEFDAMILGRGERRCFVIWNSDEKQPDVYFDDFVAWLNNGGEALAAAWLMARDIGNFDARGDAPMSRAKGEMRRNGLNPVQEWIEDCVADFRPPFHVDVVTTESVKAAIPMSYLDHKGRPSGQQMRRHLERAGCRHLGKVWSAEGAGMLGMWSCRDHGRYCGDLKAVIAARAQQLLMADAGGE